jgi:putative methionine-R-sulfoxide reductase with GAF domain
VSAPSPDRIAELLGHARDADDALRDVVATLVDDAGIAWAGIFFLDEGELVLGPSAGTPDERSERVVQIAYHGERIGELRVRGDADPAYLDRVAALVSPYVLIGWDTGGEAWDP